jgi:murein DD-endopeptidase MepM/ murein hydrolase activator NlpD
MGYGQLGGLYVVVLGPGGRRYYYAHLDRYADRLQEGDRVSTQTLLGYVGNTGNARTTPPHLHFGVYGSGWGSDERVINPLPLLVGRNWQTLEAQD